MQIDLKLVGSTCKKYLDAIKRVIKQARKDHYMDPSQMEFLFEDVKVRVNRAKRVFLEPAEIKAWKRIEICSYSRFIPVFIIRTFWVLRRISC
jgi:hypothetical protein